MQNSRTLGRYWMEHPVAALGDFLLEAGPEFFRDGLLGPQASFALTKETQYELGVLNAHLIVEEEAYSTTKRWIADLLCVAPALGERLMGLLDKNLVCGARIRSVWEQEPRFENHVALDSTKSDEPRYPSRYVALEEERG